MQAQQIKSRAQAQIEAVQLEEQAAEEASTAVQIQTVAQIHAAVEAPYPGWDGEKKGGGEKN